MKKVFQNMVKIIIIACVLEKTTVQCNRELYPLPPLPYYQNYEYVPDFIPPYHEQVPLFHPEKNLNPPFVYPKISYYSPAQLFQHNKNYNPHLPVNPGLNYQMPEVNSYAMDYQYPDFSPSQTLKPPPPNYQIFLHSDKKEPNTQLPQKPNSPQKVIKNEAQQSQYNDDQNKNYNDEDYSDNYGDENFQSNPCNTNSPYRYFEHDLNDPNSNKQFSLCGPYFYPNFGNNVYGLKTPLTLLPSRFPPRVEQFIEKIQNYFSTYTKLPQMQSHENQTEVPTTIQPATATVSESETSASLQTANFDKKNGTSENQGETNLEPAPVTEIISVEQVTEKAEVVPPIQNEQIHSTTLADVANYQNPQMEVQNIQEASQIMDNTTEANPTESLPIEQSSQGAAQEVFPTETGSRDNSHTYDYTTNELDKFTETTTEHNVVPESETPVMSTEAISSSTESALSENKTEEYNSISTTNEIFHHHNLHHHNR